MLGTLVDHRRCRPAAHRTTPDPQQREGPGDLTCSQCGQALMFCTNAAARNRGEPGYHRTYLHVNPKHEESCR